MVFPYPKGLIIVKCGSSIFFSEYCVVIAFRYVWHYFGIFYSYLRYIAIGIRSLSFAKEGKNIFGSFCRNFERKKRGQHTSDSVVKLFAQNLQKIIGYLNSSQKIPNLKKKSIKMEFGK